MGCYCNGKYHYTNTISALATGQISYKDAMCEILKRLCQLENGEYSQVQADWTETETDNPAYIKNKPSVSDFQADWNNSDTNSYGFIKNKPTIPPAQVQADWTETNVSSMAFIKNKPAIPSAQVQSNWDETDETEPSFIQNKPTIPAAQVQSDWDVAVSTNPAYIKNKPSVSDLQADWKNSDTNSYGYIKNKPTIPPEQVQADWTEEDVSSMAFIKNKPAIPSAQVQSDWDETVSTNPAYIKNKPGTLSSTNETNPTLVPPPNNVGYWCILRANGTWGANISGEIVWDTISKSQADSFSHIINQYQTYPTFGGSRGTNLFGMSTDPRNDVNDWSIIQHWPYVVGFEKVDKHYWKFHITAYINDYTCTIPVESTPFYTFGFNAELVFANSGLTWDVYKAAYNENRTYSSVKYFSSWREDTINLSDVGLNVSYTNAGGYLGFDDASGTGIVSNTLTMGRYFNNPGNESMGFGLWPLQNFQQGSWFEAELWVWL